MPVLPESGWLQSLGWAIFNSFWQMAALWLLYKGLIRFILRNNPAWKSHLATGFVLAGFLWFILTLLDFRIHGSESLDAWQASYPALQSGLLDRLSTVLPYASLVYLLLLVFPLRQFIRDYRYMRLIRNRGLEKIPGQWKVFVREMAMTLGIRRQVEIWASALVKSPVTVGFFKPLILVPLAAVNHLDTRQMESVLLHELAHIRRKDYLINFILTIIRSLLYFNPFIRWMIEEIDENRETSCDHLVMQFAYDPHQYASALLLLEKGLAVPTPTPQMVMAATGKQSGFLNRIEQILGIPASPRPFSPVRITGVLFALAIAFFIQMTATSSSKTENIAEWKSLIPLNDILANRFASPATVPVSAFETPAPEISENPSEEKELILSETVNVDPVLLANPEDFRYVNYIVAEQKKLAAEEEQKVKATVDATRKMALEMEWKMLEKEFAETLTETEKEILHQEYKKEFATRNKLKELEDKLKLQYEQLNWEKIQNQLNGALAQIQMDSVIQVIESRKEQIRSIETLMIASEIVSLPDTELSLESLRKERKRLQEELNKYRAIRDRKIIRL